MLERFFTLWRREMSAFHDLVLTDLGGQELPLAALKSQLTLVVNVAS